MRTLIRDLSLALRARVLPSLGLHAARTHDAGALAAGGDVTFAIDSEAEATLEEFLAERSPDVAFYSEDRGLVAPPKRAPCWSSTRSTARGRRSRDSSPAACRWPPRRCAKASPWRR